MLCAKSGKAVLTQTAELERVVQVQFIGLVSLCRRCYAELAVDPLFRSSVSASALRPIMLPIWPARRPRTISCARSQANLTSRLAREQHRTRTDRRYSDGSACVGGRSDQRAYDAQFRWVAWNRGGHCGGCLISPAIGTSYRRPAGQRWRAIHRLEP